jgi:hypothetical protein
VQSEPNRATHNTAPDFLLEDHGSLVLLRPLTACAREWVEKNIGRDNGFQPYWPTVVIEPRYVQAILDGIVEAEMTVGVPR